MQFKDEGYIAAIRRYGENSLIVNVITKEHGLIGGFVKGGGSKKNAGIYQPGNRISVDAYARIEENSGTMTVVTEDSVDNGVAYAIRMSGGF